MLSNKFWSDSQEHALDWIKETGPLALAHISKENVSKALLITLKRILKRNEKRLDLLIRSKAWFFSITKTKVWKVTFTL